MPPEYTYTFKNGRVEISIRCYRIEDAVLKLKSIMRSDLEDYQVIDGEHDGKSAAQVMSELPRT